MEALFCAGAVEKVGRLTAEPLGEDLRIGMGATVTGIHGNRGDMRLPISPVLSILAVSSVSFAKTGKFLPIETIFLILPIIWTDSTCDDQKLADRYSRFEFG